MSRIVSLAVAFTLLAGASALAQNSDTSSAPAAPPAASGDAGGAPADASKAAPDAGMHHHHHHHGQQARNSGSTDNDADKLNACQVNASPTPEQQQCLRHAENSPS
jgi:hypothetical protein